MRRPIFFARVPCRRPFRAAARAVPIEVIDIFRRSEFVGSIVDEAIPLTPKLIWLQVGVRDIAACARAEAAGISCVMDRCLMVDHQQLQV